MPVTVTPDFVYDGPTAGQELYHPSVQTPEIQQLFTFRPNIKSKQQIPVVGVLSDIVKLYTGCGQAAVGDVDINNCTIETANLYVHFSQCMDEFRTHFIEDWLDPGLQSMQGSARIRAIINKLVLDAMRRDNFRILSFGDVTSLSTKYNQLDGLWTQAIADSTAYCYPTIDSSLGTGTLAAGKALSTLKAMYEGAPIVLKQLENSNKGFYVTGSVYENLLSSYESNATGSDAQFALLQKGPGGNLTYRGINVYPYYAWDNDLLDTVNPLNGLAKHLILYTTRAIHIIGMERMSDQNSVRGYFWEEDEKYHIKGMYNLGYKACLCELAAISY